jgi:hypothetical protein
MPSGRSTIFATPRGAGKHYNAYFKPFFKQVA